MSELRSLVREILAQELAALRGGDLGAREEAISIRDDAELAAFVRRILTISRDERARAAIEAGRHVFRLSTSPAAPMHAHQPLAPAPHAPPPPVRFNAGLVTEKDVAGLADGMRAVSVGRAVRFTPLARDELRRKGIRIERTAS